ncbi:MAG: WbuC family cupin fold metalloprotein [Pseudomonadota bacterium]
MNFEDNELTVKITPSKLEHLEKAAKTSERQRSRFILHKGHNDNVQEMVIAITSQTYIMPHRQKNRTKSYTLLNGKFGVIFFDEQGVISDVIKMDNEADRPVLVRFDADQWHSVVAGSDVAIYIETAQGPFEGSLWADWAPKSEDSNEGLDYLEFMKKSVFQP